MLKERYVFDCTYVGPGSFLRFHYPDGSKKNFILLSPGSTTLSVIEVTGISVMRTKSIRATDVVSEDIKIECFGMDIEVANYDLIRTHVEFDSKNIDFRKGDRVVVKCIMWYLLGFVQNIGNDTIDVIVTPSKKNLTPTMISIPAIKVAMGNIAISKYDGIAPMDAYFDEDIVHLLYDRKQCSTE